MDKLKKDKRFILQNYIKQSYAISFQRQDFVNMV